jgi:predicted nucleic acid-binding protein
LWTGSLSTTHVIEAAATPEFIRTDPDDNIVLACAAGGRADVIVSGDQDLVSLGAYENIPILTAAQFLVWWESAQT